MTDGKKKNSCCNRFSVIMQMDKTIDLFRRKKERKPNESKWGCRMESKRITNYDREMGKEQDFEAYHRRSSVWSTAPFHAHEFFELYFFISGNTRIVLEDKTFSMRPGDFMIFPPDTLHRCVIDDNCEPYERMYFYATRSFLQHASTPEFDMEAILDDFAERGAFRFQLGDAFFNQCGARLDEIIAVAQSSSPARLAIRRGMLSALLALVCQRLTEEEHDVAEDTPSEIDDLLHYVRAHFLEDIDPDELAARFFMSKYYMMHKFKQHTNTSLHQYVLVKRILLAKGMLRDGIAAGEVATRCGFADYSCFYRAFRKIVNLSPQDYVRSYAGKNSAATEFFRSETVRARRAAQQ